MLIYIRSYVFIPALQDLFYGLSNIHTELPVHVFLHIEPVFRKYRRLLRVLRMADTVNPEIYNEWFQIGFSVFSAMISSPSVHALRIAPSPPLTGLS